MDNETSFQTSLAEDAVLTDGPSYKLEAFEGPLDLLLSLIAKNKVSIYDIPIALIFDQYMEYIELMKQNNLEVASEFIVMASQLMLIKSRMLLPKREDDEEEDDPRRELVDMLLEYQRAKTAAGLLHERELTYWGRFEKPPEKLDIPPEYTLTHDIEILRSAFLSVFDRTKNAEEDLSDFRQNLERHLTATKTVSVEERIGHVMKRLGRGKKKCTLIKFFDDVSTKSEAVATFLALLELVKDKRVKIVYTGEDFSDCDIELIEESAADGGSTETKETEN